MKIKFLAYIAAAVVAFWVSAMPAAVAQNTSGGRLDLPFVINHGPYLQGMGQDQVTIVWTTSEDAIAWVELAPDDGSHFYQTERPRIYASSHGFKDVDRVHRVVLQDLQPGTNYRYRAYSQQILSHEGTAVQYGKIAATAVYRQQPLSFRTADHSRPMGQFVMINDIHGRNDMMQKLLALAPVEETDLVFFNGDMADNLRSEEQMFEHFMDTGVELFAKETPMFYARGNHETRGNFASRFAEYFPTQDGKLYYLHRDGPICYVVLDCGEDKPDSDMEYSGIVLMDQYRSEQAEWLKEALKSPVYQDAPFKVVICHMPPIGDWHGVRDIAQKFLPILNENGAQIMLSGHTHRHILLPADPNGRGGIHPDGQRSAAGVGHNFPILVNANDAVLLGKGTAESGLEIKIIDQNGAIRETVKLPSSMQ